MTANEDQEMELEALRSIYEGDDCFKEISPVSFQFRVGELEDSKAFILDFTWPEAYPESAPQISLDAFFNNRLSSQTKQQIVSRVEEQVEANLGGAMMYTLFEWAKENQESLMEDHQPVVTAVISCTDVSTGTEGKKKEKKEQLTKSQKRKITCRTAEQNGRDERLGGDCGREEGRYLVLGLYQTDCERVSPPTERLPPPTERLPPPTNRLPPPTKRQPPPTERVSLPPPTERVLVSRSAPHHGEPLRDRNAEK
ncbi:hypothetical protein CRUP_029755 [Coryphaenoides rupestris]|nr:hypothetical protein CRUP_029755 [Coryphaenoides rupestris]